MDCGKLFSKYWEHSHTFNNEEDINQDSCSGFFGRHGEIARQALNKFHESTTKGNC
jgi:hypothetical protein